MPEGNSANTETIDKNLAVKGDLTVTGAINLPTDPATFDSLVVTGAATAATLALAGGSVLAKYLTASAALDFGSILTLAQADLTIAVTGAAVGDNVALGLPAAPEAGMSFMAFVSSTNVVTVRATNTSGSTIDSASATYRVAVFK